MDEENNVFSSQDSSSFVDSSDDYMDEFELSLRQHTLFILDKRITTTVTCHAQHVRHWIRQTELHNSPNPLRLIVGFDIKLGAPDPSRPVALLLLFVHRTCLLFQIDYADKVPTSLSRFLADRRNNTFVGVGIQSKLLQLQREFGVGGSARWVDLATVTAARYSRPEMKEAGVGQLRTFLHGEDVVRPSPAVVDDWDDEELPYAHVQTACIDAYTCYELGSYLVFPLPRATP